MTSQRKSASQSQHTFARIPGVTQPRSTFDRSKSTKTTFDAGKLIPVMCDEMLPGDTLRCSMSNYVRMSVPLINPILDNMYLESQFFFCPARLLMDNFTKLMGEQIDPDDSIDFLIPQMTVVGGADTGAELLSDYLGIPPAAGTVTVSSMWHRMYQKVYNDWYRDQNLQDTVVVDLDDGPDTESDYVIRRRGKRPDYFTSALPFQQKGTAIGLPLGSTAPVVSTGDGTPTWTVDGSSRVLASGASTPLKVEWNPTPSGADDAVWLDPKLEADLSGAVGSTIVELYESFALQALLQRDARGGTRYVESLKTHWGVTSPDFRLQRSEFLGGGSQRVNISPVAATIQSAVVDQGTLAAYATSSGKGHGFVYSATEHGYLMCIISVRADYTYQNGIHRMFSRRDRYDFYDPDLAHLGEQAILNKEIYADDSANDDLVWGYQEAWAEYRFGQSQITGKFRTAFATSLDPWHLAEEFESVPPLGTSFIQESPPIDRILAVTTEPDFIGDFYFSMDHSRVMPTYSVPGLNNRF